MKMIVRNLIAIALLPVAIGFALSLYNVITGITYSCGMNYVLYGFCAYIVVHFVFHKPLMTYVFAHEFTHALWAIPFGGTLRDFRAGVHGGHVTVTRQNAVIAVAPYFFPLYAYLILGMYLIFHALGIGDRVSPVFGLLVGFFLSFHLLFTFRYLFTRQSDFRRAGYFLSVDLIVIMNSFFCALILKGLKPEVVDFGEFLKKSIDYAVSVLLTFV